MVKNPPSNAGDADLIPGWGTKNPHASEQLSPHAATKTQHNQKKMIKKITLKNRPHRMVWETEKIHVTDLL